MEGIRIVSKIDGFRRAGIAHTREPKDYRVDAFTDAQLQALAKEPNLTIVSIGIDEPRPEVKLEKLNKEDLIAHAKKTFDLTLEPELTKAAMIEAIGAAAAAAAKAEQQ